MSNSKLPVDDVYIGHHFRNRMFDLETRIHFNEVKMYIGPGNEFYSARVRIPNISCKIECCTQILSRNPGIDET